MILDKASYQHWRDGDKHVSPGGKVACTDRHGFNGVESWLLVLVCGLLFCLEPFLAIAQDSRKNTKFLSWMTEKQADTKKVLLLVALLLSRLCLKSHANRPD